MKKITVAFVLTLILAMATGTAWADISQILEKLSQTAKNMKIEKDAPFPTFPLTAEESAELIDSLQKRLEKDGQKLNRDQAALMAGLIPGYVGGCSAALEARGSTQGKQESAPVAQVNLPNFDTSAYCKRVSSAGGGSYMIESGCMDMEKTAKAELAKRQDIPAKIMQYCTRVAKTGGGSYSTLQGCIDMELQSKKQLEK